MSEIEPLQQDPDAEDEGFVANYLLYLLAAASDAASADFHAHVRAEGLRVPEWRVLACLHDRDGSMITRLASLALIEQSSLTKMIIQMADRGLVVRRGDDRDRRRVRVYLTEEGRKLADRLVVDARRHEAELMMTLDDSDWPQIKRTLSALIARFAKPDEIHG